MRCDPVSPPGSLPRKPRIEDFHPIRFGPGAARKRGRASSAWRCRRVVGLCGIETDLRIHAPGRVPVIPVPSLPYAMKAPVLPASREISGFRNPSITGFRNPGIGLTLEYGAKAACYGDRARASRVEEMPSENQQDGSFPHRFHQALICLSRQDRDRPANLPRALP